MLVGLKKRDAGAQSLAFGPELGGRDISLTPHFRGPVLLALATGRLSCFMHPLAVLADPKLGKWHDLDTVCFIQRQDGEMRVSLHMTDKATIHSGKPPRIRLTHDLSFERPDIDFVSYDWMLPVPDLPDPPFQVDSLLRKEAEKNLRSATIFPHFSMLPVTGT